MCDVSCNLSTIVELLCRDTIVIVDKKILNPVVI